MPGFGVAAGVVVGHAPELRIKLAMKIVAYALIEKASLFLMMTLEYSKT